MQALLAMAVMTALVLLRWYVQGVRQRNNWGGTSGQDGSVGRDTSSEGQGWFGGHSYSGDHGGTSDAGVSDGGGGDGGGSDGGGGGGSD